MSQKRPPIIAVRPRKGSDLERIQAELKNNMADTIHAWAFAQAHAEREKTDE